MAFTVRCFLCLASLCFQQSFAETACVSYHYDAWSQLHETFVTKGLHTLYQYDGYGDIRTLSHYQKNSTSQHLITRFSYQYQPDDMIVKRVRIDDMGNQAVKQYGYDDNHHLQAYRCSGLSCPHDGQGKIIQWQRYTFDALNNIKTICSHYSCIRYDYDAQMPTRLIGYDNSKSGYPCSHKLTYDRNGNIVLDDQDQVLSYDPLNRLHSVRNSHGTVAYFYNGAGQQVGVVSPQGQSTYFIYGQHKLLTRFIGKASTEFLYGLNRVGQRDAEGMAYYLADQSQSVVNTVRQKPDGSWKRQQYEYGPYGVSRSVPLFGFDGALTDDDTGWQFLGQGYRAYSPTLHRFMSQDSLSPFDQGGLNGYLFADNNPLANADPSGHFSVGMLFLALFGMVTDVAEIAATEGVDVGADAGLISNVTAALSLAGVPGAHAISVSSGVISAFMGQGLQSSSALYELGFVYKEAANQRDMGIFVDDISQPLMLSRVNTAYCASGQAPEEVLRDGFQGTRVTNWPDNVFGHRTVFASGSRTGLYQFIHSGLSGATTDFPVDDYYLYKITIPEHVPTFSIRKALERTSREHLALQFMTRFPRDLPFRSVRQQYATYLDLVDAGNEVDELDLQGPIAPEYIEFVSYG